MAFKDFRTRAERREAATEQPAKPGTTYIDEGCELSGKLRFREAVRVDGRIDGQIEGEDTVVVGESGRIHATIDSDCVVIYGSVEGNISAKRKITLHKTAHVTGDMRTAGIVIEEGAKVKGHIVIGATDAAANKKSTAAAERSADSGKSKPAARPSPGA